MLGISTSTGWNFGRRAVRPGTGRKVEVVSEEAARLLLDGVAAQQVTLQQQIALKIRAELVCCDIYQICADSLWPTPQMHWEDWQVELNSRRQRHAICYYGEWAARIAEQFVPEQR